MDVTQELLEKRIAALIADREQLVATLNATAGAIEDCEYWLGVIKEGAAK